MSNGLQNVWEHFIKPEIIYNGKLKLNFDDISINNEFNKKYYQPLLERKKLLGASENRNV